MFILCIIRHIRKDQQYALICTTPLFYVLASTCFSSSLPSSGSLLDPPELLVIQIELVVYHIMCGYVTRGPDCHGNSAHRSHNLNSYFGVQVLFKCQWQQEKITFTVVQEDQMTQNTPNAELEVRCIHFYINT
jgi:hypothetical protein